MYWDTKSAVVAVRVTRTVPVPVKVPAPLIRSAAAGVSVPVTVIVVPTLKFPLLGTVPLTVRLANANVPEFVIDPVAPLTVTVPPLGEKLTPGFTVSALATE